MSEEYPKLQISSLTSKLHYGTMKPTCAWHLGSPLHQPASLDTLFSTRPRSSFGILQEQTYSLYKSAVPCIAVRDG